MLLRVIPTRPDLPRLRYSRFRTLPRGAWLKAVAVVCGYIDEAFRDQLPNVRENEAMVATSGLRRSIG